jgi:hypothetical protein
MSWPKRKPYTSKSSFTVVRTVVMKLNARLTERLDRFGESGRATFGEARVEGRITERVTRIAHHVSM